MNLLPYDGLCEYSIPFGYSQIQDWYQALHEEVQWEHDRLKMYGKEIITKRKVGWYGDQPYAYTYSHVQKVALSWTPTLSEIKQKVESVSQESYNSCLLNFYHTGTEGMGWHSDDEPELLPQGTIASISLGPDRRFHFRHKRTKEKVTILLENGSLLLMKGSTQTHWQHQLPPTKKVHTSRINLTFRTIVDRP